MASITMSHWKDSANDDYEFPVINLGDLSNAPDATQNEHGPFAGMCTAYGGSIPNMWQFKGSEVGVFPAEINYSNTIRGTLEMYGRTEGTFYPSEDTISGPHYFRASLYQPNKVWLNYYGHGSGDSYCQTNDVGGWDVPSSRIHTMFAVATINGNTYFGLYYTGSLLGPGSGDSWDAWVFAYTPGDTPYQQIFEYLSIDDGPPNPYRHGGYSAPGGGDSNKQNFSDTSDFVNPDSLPDETEYSAVACGLITIFSPNKAQIQNLADLLWNKTFFDWLEHEFSGIEDLFISFGLVPFTVTKGSNATITFMNFTDYITPGPHLTTVTLTQAANQFMEFNMGNVSLTGNDDRMYASDSVLDYSPYSKLSIYLPFIGTQELDIDECRGKTINLKYRIDILSGACVAIISINGRTMYQFSGNCLTQLPLTSSDYSSMVANAVNVAIAASSAGTAGAIASAGDALTSSRVESGAIEPLMGDYQNAQHAAQVSNAENSLAGATANGMMGMKPNFKKTGAISGSTGLMAVKQPHLILTTPRQSMPEGYEKVCGFPCNIGGKLGDFTGYTVVEDVRLNGLVATSPEVEEIYKLLKSGIII